jgi:hypothetical protein
LHRLHRMVGIAPWHSPPPMLTRFVAIVRRSLCGPRNRRRADVAAAPDLCKRFITPRRWNTRRGSFRISAAKAMKRRDLAASTLAS